jgi:flagellar biosynthesis/type III secretory pathway M-ring protein FliF/YscJ
MAFWIWVVVVLVLSLVAYELFSWIRRRTRPAQEETSEDAKMAAEAQAELVRANIKIAVLERRLQDEEIKHEDEQAVLEEKHKQQIAKTEAAYQRQMVALSERLAKNGKGDWRVAAEREKAKKRVESEQYPVRMAAEIAA